MQYVLLIKSFIIVAAVRSHIISRSQNQTALTGHGPVIVGANEVVQIWCRVENTAVSNIVRALFWRFDNGTRLPFVNKGDSSKQDVYMEKFAGLNQSDPTRIWIRVLHFSRTKPSSAGNYTCVANLAGIFNNLTVEVSGE